MNPQNAAAQLLYKIVGGVIPQPAKEPGMLVQAQHEQIALVSLYAFHDRPALRPPQQVRVGFISTSVGILCGPMRGPITNSATAYPNRICLKTGFEREIGMTESWELPGLWELNGEPTEPCVS